MFRRFRRSREKAAPPPAPPVMLPPPEVDDYPDTATPTIPLRTVRPEDLRPPPRPPHASVSRPISATVDPEEVARALEAYVNAETWDASRQIVEDHPELLTNTALMLLRANISRVAEQIGPGAAQLLNHYLQTLEIARLEGIDFAFARSAPAQEMFAPDLDDLLTQLEAPNLSLTRKVMLCEEALPLAARDQQDELWAALQREIGMLLPRLGGDPSQQVERSIEALEAALTIFTRIDYPVDWAMTQHYLGIALLQRQDGDRALNIEQAIECFGAALEIRRRDTLPQDWATTQEALGSAWFQRLDGERATNIDNCIVAYEAALQVRSREKTPLEWATDQVSLGNAYGQRISGARLGNLEQSITCFEAALTWFTPQQQPEEWCLIHHNLGVAYMDRLLGNRADNIERAIAYYRGILDVQTATSAPIEWAGTLNNLGNALRERVHGDKAANLQEAIHCYQQSLKIRQRDIFPNEHRRTARNLGTVLVSLERWSEAHDQLASAIAASEILYLFDVGQAGTNGVSRLRDHLELVALDAYCLLKMNRPRDAVQRMERGRLRAFNEVLERDQGILRSQSPALRSAFVQGQTRLVQTYAAARRLAEGETVSYSAQDVAYERQQAQKALESAVQSIQQQRAEFLYPPLSFKQISDTIGNQQALVYLTTTSLGTLGLIVPASVNELGPDHLLWVPSLTTARLDDMMTATGPGGASQNVLTRLPAIDEALTVLSSALMTPLATKLAAMRITSVVLIPSGHLAALPLHAAPVGPAAPVRDDEGMAGEARDSATFLDAFEVLYAPNAHRLGLARVGSLMSLRSGLAAVGNPQPMGTQLPFAEFEAESVAQVASQHSQSCTLLIRRQATKEAVSKVMKEKSYLHLACRTMYHPERPRASSIELAEEQRLTMDDLLSGSVPLRGVRLVVLSTGQTIASTQIAADESIGIATALLTCGVSCVVTALWPASDIASLLLMRRFAQNYLDDQRPAMALRNAQRWLSSLTAREISRDFAHDLSHDPDYNLADYARPDECPFAHPVYWAGYIVTGM